MTTTDDALSRYYAARVCEYEQVYLKPERQADLAQLRRLVPGYFADRRVLEIACGTGYWTALIAPVARHVVATDFNSETLAIACTKVLPAGRVEFERADAYRLPAHCRGFDAAFAGFWWSHVRRAERRAFIASLHRSLVPGAVVVALDNRYVAGSSTPIARVDDEGNNYQRRRLADGSEHIVLKNFPDEMELIAEVRDCAAAVEYIVLDYYWVFKYELAA